MKNKKGFTLVELIGVIIIIGILSIIAISVFTNDLDKFREDYYTNLERTITQSGKEFFTDNRNFRPTNTLYAQKVSLDTLEKQGYVGSIVDYNNGKCVTEDNIEKNYILVIKKGRSDYEYHACILCADDDFSTLEDKYCDPIWLDGSTVEYGFSEEPNIYVYKNATRDELREKLEINVSVVKYASDGITILDSVDGKEIEGSPKILPENIDTVDTSKVGEYTVKYNYNGKLAAGHVHVYENKKATVSFQKVNKIATDYKGNESEQKGTYTPSEWAQKIIITFNPPSKGSGKDYRDAGAGIARYQIYYGGVWKDACTLNEGQSTCSYTLSAEMNENVKFRYVDTNGNVSEETQSYLFKIDNTDPGCELKLEGTLGENDWYTSDVNVSFANDKDNIGIDNSAVSGTKVSIVQKNGTAFSRGTSITSKVQNTDTKSVKYVGYVEDAAGNSNVCNITFKRDATTPICTMIVTNTLKKDSQTITVNCSDNLGVTKYYYGTTPTEFIVTGTSIEKKYTVKDAGTYKAYVKDDAGNTATTQSKTLYTYDVYNYLLNIKGAKGTYNTSNYSLTSNATYIAPTGTVLTLSGIYTTPTGGTFKGYTAGGAISTTAPTLSANSTYSMWFDRNEYTFTVKSSVGGSTKAVSTQNTTGVTAASNGSNTLTVRYGDTVTLSASSSAGYRFDKYTGDSTAATISDITENKTVTGNYEACGTGTYSLGNVTSCSACPEGYKDGAGTTAQDKCVKSVAAGNYVGTAKSGTSACAKGTYIEAHNVTYGKTSSCSTCPEGYKDGDGTTSQDKCVKSVAAGSYVETKNGAAKACGKGTYKGAHNVTYGSTSSCSACPEGYKDGDGTTSQDKCVKSVAVGSYVETKNGAAKACGKGTYKGAHNVTYGSTSSCSACPEGYKDGDGTTSQDKCVKSVAAGNYVGTAKGGTSACATGYGTSAHNVTYGKTSSCTANSYTLTYDNNGGSGCTTKSGTYNEKWGTLCSPTANGYTFLGWFTASTNGTQVTADTKVDGNKTVYAHWELTNKTPTVQLKRLRGVSNGRCGVAEVNEVMSTVCTTCTGGTCPCVLQALYITPPSGYKFSKVVVSFDPVPSDHSAATNTWTSGDGLATFKEITYFSVTASNNENYGEVGVGTNRNFFTSGDTVILRFRNENGTSGITASVNVTYSNGATGTFTKKYEVNGSGCCSNNRTC